tara:strand:+ start:518 stop:745 length:228 start_codon:yes stop_codon:yes gene_type:complete
MADNGSGGFNEQSSTTRQGIVNAVDSTAPTQGLGFLARVAASLILDSVRAHVLAFDRTPQEILIDVNPLDAAVVR